MQMAINKLVDYCHVLTFVANQSNQLAKLSQFGIESAQQEGYQPLLQSESMPGGINISFVAGTINDGEDIRMQRMLFRITRGKALTHFSAPFIQDKKQKLVYMVVYQDGQMIKDRIQKICDSFMGSRFEINNLGDQLFDDLARVRNEITDSRSLLKTSKIQLRDYLISINGENNVDVPSQLEIYHNHVSKEKAIYTVINQLQ